MRHTTPFAAQFGVKSTKMQGKMRQNTLHLAPKRKAKCCKLQAHCNNMQCEKGIKHPLDRLK